MSFGAALITLWILRVVFVVGMGIFELVIDRQARPKPPKPPRQPVPEEAKAFNGFALFFGIIAVLALIFPSHSPAPKASGIPPGYELDTDPAPPRTKPVAIPPPAGTNRTFVPPVPAPEVEAKGWGVDDLSGAWPADEIRPASARADRLLRRFHAAQGLEVGE